MAPLEPQQVGTHPALGPDTSRPSQSPSDAQITVVSKDDLDQTATKRTFSLFSLSFSLSLCDVSAVSGLMVLTGRKVYKKNKRWRRIDITSGLLSLQPAL